jgi:tryptophan synthase beta chain
MVGLEILSNLLKQGGRNAGTNKTMDTGAGQWGSALAMACRSASSILTWKSTWSRSAITRSPTGASSWTYGFGAQVHPSPSDHTHSGQATLAADPDNPGSLGLATPRRLMQIELGGYQTISVANAKSGRPQ